jgi:hypothetical protein
MINKIADHPVLILGKGMGKQGRDFKFFPERWLSYRDAFIIRCAARFRQPLGFEM